MKSIRLRIFSYYMILVAMIAIVFSLGVNSFIDGYYYGKKIQTMSGVVSDVEKMYNISQSEDEALRNIEYLGYLFEGKISIYDKNTNMILYANRKFQYTEGVIIEEITYKDSTAYVYETAYPVEGARWLIYFEQLENDKIAMLQIPVVAIDEAIQIIRDFFNILLFMAFIIAFMLSLVLSRNLTLPIKDLHKVATDIYNLQFHRKYLGKRQDEIGQLGDQLNHISSKLEETIRDLQIELAKKQKLDLLRRRFVAQVSHELQTPIAIISSYVEALSDGIVEEEETEYYFQVITDESEKMSKIIKDLLQLSQLEANTLSFHMEKLELKAYLHGLMSRYQLIIEKKELKLNFQDFSASESLFVMADSLRLEQGIGNIISNSIKHSKSLINVSLTREQGRIILSIENDGEKIRDEDLPNIFESFYKGRSQSIKEGTGLGLAIASNIFQKHHMEYELKNTVAGVIFLLRIPEWSEEN
ncbi:MAG: HAMP domain-containing histidine kinase [Vallitaleaceae bacterium]|nr:HAMP domain-containing histidine kinase [Vallitaleaceae bacterium]